VWVEVLAKILAAGLPMRYGLAIRFPIILADCAIVAFVWIIGYQKTLRQATQYGLFYAFNPIAIIISCLHGQFDALPILFGLLAMHLLVRSKRMYWSAIALSLAIAWKSFPILFLYPLWLDISTSSKKLIFGLLAVVPVGLLLLPFLITSFGSVQRELLGYRGSALLGFVVPIRMVYVPLAHLSFPVTMTLRIISQSSIIFGILYALLAWQAMPRQGLLTRLIMTIALFYAVYGGIAPQYLIWIVPFLLLNYERSPIVFWTYTIAGTLALVGFYAYAIPATLLIRAATASQLPKVLYGIGGTAWWLTCICIVFCSLDLGRSGGGPTASATFETAIG
jgi:hypothetical protein